MVKKLPAFREIRRSTNVSPPTGPYPKPHTVWIASSWPFQFRILSRNYRSSGHLVGLSMARQHKPHAHASSGIQTHDPDIPAVEVYISSASAAVLTGHNIPMSQASFWHDPFRFSDQNLRPHIPSGACYIPCSHHHHQNK
jgi:hypothetical protein